MIFALSGTFSRFGAQSPMRRYQLPLESYHLALSFTLIVSPMRNAAVKTVLSIAGPLLSDSLCYEHRFSLPDAPEICYDLREKASNSGSERKGLPHEDGRSL